MVGKARRSFTGGPVAESERHAITLEAMRSLDRAAAKGILHPNNAARRKARLARQLAHVQMASASAAGTGGTGGRRSAAKGAAGSAATATPATTPKKK